MNLENLSRPLETYMNLTVELYGTNRAAMVTHASPSTTNDPAYSLAESEANTAINQS